MNIKSYELLIKSESTAKKYVLGFCFKNQQRFCPFCGSRKFWKLADGRRRCQRCKRAYHDLTKRWWNEVKLPMDDWLRIVKLFELELPYYKVFKALMTIRYAILCHAADANGRAKTLLGITVKKVRRGSVVYTDKYKTYDSLMCCGYRHLNVDHSSRFCDGKVHINGLEGFWSWAKERLFKHHGVSAKNFPLYLKELEFRYNHRDESIFESLVGFLSDLVPELPPTSLASGSQRDELPLAPASP